MGSSLSLNIEVHDKDEGKAPIASFTTNKDITVSTMKYKLRSCCPMELKDEEIVFECDNAPQLVNDTSKIFPDLVLEPIEWKYTNKCFVRRMYKVNNEWDKQFLIYVWWKKSARRLYVTESHTVRSVKNYIQKNFHGMDVLGKDFVLYRFRDGHVLEDTETLLKSGVGPGFMVGIEPLTWERKTPGHPPAVPYTVTVIATTDLQGFNEAFRILTFTVFVRPSERLDDVRLKLRMDADKDKLELLFMFNWEVCLSDRARGSYNRDSTLELLNVGPHSKLELVGQWGSLLPTDSAWKFILDLDPLPLVPNITESGDTPLDLNKLSVIDGAEFVRKFRYDIAQRLEPLQSILTYLCNKDVLNAEEEEVIQSRPTRTEKNRTLIDMICKKGEASMRVFYEALKHYNSYLVNDLNKKP